MILGSVYPRPHFTCIYKDEILLMACKHVSPLIPFLKEENGIRFEIESTSMDCLQIKLDTQNINFSSERGQNMGSNRTRRQNVYLHRTITKYYSTTIFHSFFICHTKLRTRKNLQFIGNLPEKKNNNNASMCENGISILNIFQLQRAQIGK